MRVLIACEESATIREAFKAKGHDAWSCDLKPSKILGQHFKEDVFNVLNLNWDLIILHPPCTYTALCGNRHYYNSHLRLEGVELCKKMWEEANKHCSKVVLEQPKTIMQRFIGKKSQVIHPWQFGHGETKETWLWIRGLPLLEATNIVEGRENRVWKMAPTKNPEERREKRSKTYVGIAQAMAEQWGERVKEEIYKKIVSDDESRDNRYILLGRGKSKYDPKRKVFTEAALGQEFDIVFLQHGYRKFVEFEAVFEKHYRKINQTAFQGSETNN